MNVPSFGRILCCLCGSSIEPNDAAMCVECLRINCDITEGIEKHCDIIECGKCGRWKIKQDQWQNHELESSSLLSLCLKKIGGLQQSGTKILEACWVWTEPHSKRLKIAVDIEKAVMDGKISIRQRVIVEFEVKNKQCHDCIRENTDHTWGGLIQVRQHVGHKKTLYYLETLLNKAEMYHYMTNVQVKREGIDLYFKSKVQTEKVADFIADQYPVRIKTSKKVVSQNLQMSTASVESTIHIELAALCRDDLVVVPKTFTSGAAELLLVSKLSSSVHLLNPVNLNKIDISATKYFAKPFTALLSSKQLVPFLVLDVQVLDHQSSGTNNSGNPSTSKVGKKRGNKKKQGNNHDDDDNFNLLSNPISSTALPVSDTSNADTMPNVDTSHNSVISNAAATIAQLGGVLAEVEIAREADMGANDDTFIVTTHLGHLLQAGDTVLGYDLMHAVFNATNEDAIAGLRVSLPDVVLVRKQYPERDLKKKNNPKKKKGAKSNETNNLQEGLEDDKEGDKLIAASEKESFNQSKSNGVNSSDEEDGDEYEDYDEMDGLEEIADDDEEQPAIAAVDCLDEETEDNEAANKRSKASFIGSKKSDSATNRHFHRAEGKKIKRGKPSKKRVATTKNVSDMSMEDVEGNEEDEQDSGDEEEEVGEDDEDNEEAVLDSNSKVTRKGTTKKSSGASTISSEGGGGGEELEREQFEQEMAQLAQMRLDEETFFRTQSKTHKK